MGEWVSVWHTHRAKSVELVRSVVLNVLHAGIFLLDADMTSVPLFRSLVTIQSMCKGITQTLIPDPSAVKPKVSQSTNGNLLWSVVYISDTACLRMGMANDLLTS
jgi:hypothetical protein